MVLVCAECGCESGACAIGWRAYLGEPDEDAPEENEQVFVFCPGCAVREFLQ